MGPRVTFLPQGVSRAGRTRGAASFAAFLALAMLLAACQQAAPAPTATTAPKPAPAPTAAPAAAPTTAPAAVATTAPAAAPTAAPAVATKPAQLTNLVFGGVGSLGMILFNSGIKLGVWEREGLKMEAIEHRGGAEGAQALVGGGVQIAGVDFAHVVRLNEGGQMIKALAPGISKFSYVLLGPPGSPANAAATALKGKKIGISSPGSSTDNVIRWYLKDNKMDPDKDVELVAIGSGAPMVAALQNKQIDFGMSTEPFTTQLLKINNYVVVVDLQKILGLYYNNVYSVHESWVKANGNTAKAFLRGLFKYMGDLDKDAALRTQARKIDMPTLDEKIADDAFKAVLDLFSRDPKILEQGVLGPIKVGAAATGKEGPVPDWRKYVDDSYNP